MKFKKVKAGEWQMPIMKAYKMSCCDCGLVHNIHFGVINEKTHKKIKGARVIMKAYRNEKLTKQERKKRA